MNQTPKPALDGAGPSNAPVSARPKGLSALALVGAGMTAMALAIGAWKVAPTIDFGALFTKADSSEAKTITANDSSTTAFPSIMIVDVGRIIAAWSMLGSAEESPEKFLARLRSVFESYGKRGIVLVEQQFALTVPANADATEEVARALSVPIAQLEKAASSTYTQPPTPSAMRPAPTPAEGPALPTVGTKPAATLKENPKLD